MISGKTKEGFEWEISDDALDDWEIFEILEDISDNSKLASKKLCVMLFGEEQYKKLKEFYRDPITKRVKLTKLSEVIFEILSSNSKAKN